jgi:catechol 2,3-dioxygenase-like lactoylglutathione lyase family enzyme
MKFQPPIPVLRILDVDLAKAFYGNWLGFTLDWTHQFEPGFPSYL